MLSKLNIEDKSRLVQIVNEDFDFNKDNKRIKCLTSKLKSEQDNSLPNNVQCIQTSLINNNENEFKCDGRKNDECNGKYLCEIDEKQSLREYRTQNIGILLETPIKVSKYLKVPPTPGIFAPSLDLSTDTQTDAIEAMRVSSSFLFGSCEKSDTASPMKAITPGVRISASTLLKDNTSRYIKPNGYFTNNCYYNPDQNINLNGNIHKIIELDDSINNSEPIQVNEGNIALDKEKSGNVSLYNSTVETLKVTPTVLKRVKSFDLKDTQNTYGGDPHYKLAFGLPEEIDAEGDNPASLLSSSSGSSTSSSGTSSSSTASSTSSSPSSSKGNENKSPVKQILNNLNNLSDVSSTEDDDWQLLPDNTVNDSQLISKDGEVRYPVRSWLTSIQEKQSYNTQSENCVEKFSIEKAADIKSDKDEFIKNNIHQKDLELKRERIKEKLKNDSSKTVNMDRNFGNTGNAPNINAAIAASRLLHAMRDTRRRSLIRKKSSEPMNIRHVTSKIERDDKHPIDVLTALQLSAKTKDNGDACDVIKEQSMKNIDKPFTSIIDQTDHIANYSQLKKGDEQNSEVLSSKKTSQRRNLPIEVRPVNRTICKSATKVSRAQFSFRTRSSVSKEALIANTLPALTTVKGKMRNTSSVILRTSNSRSLTIRTSPRLAKSKYKLSTQNTNSIKLHDQINAGNNKEESNIKNKSSTKIDTESFDKQIKIDKEVEKNKINTTLRISDEVNINDNSSLKPIINIKCKPPMISMKNRASTKLKSTHCQEKNDQNNHDKNLSGTQNKLGQMKNHMNCVKKNKCEKSEQKNQKQALDIIKTKKSTSKEVENCAHEDISTTVSNEIMNTQFVNHGKKLRIQTMKGNKYPKRPNIEKQNCQKCKTNLNGICTCTSEILEIVNNNFNTSNSCDQNKNRKINETDSKPVASSTPIIKKIIKQTIKQSSYCMRESNGKILTSLIDDTTNIQIEDIDTILSHIHGD